MSDNPWPMKNGRSYPAVGTVSSSRAASMNTGLSSDFVSTCPSVTVPYFVRASV